MEIYKFCRCLFVFLSLIIMVYMLLVVQFFGSMYNIRPLLQSSFNTKGNFNRSGLSKPQKLDEKQNDEGDGITRVLVVTYMRSGSTLIGDILQRYNNSTYAFEPLRYIGEDVKKGINVTFLNGTERSYMSTDYNFVMAEVLYRWFTCDIQKINNKDLTSQMLEYSKAYGDYYRCIIKQNKTNPVPKASQLVNGCLELLQRPCNTSKVLIIKTIRLDMTSVELLLKWLPGLKVLHLLRDPRGKLSSEFKMDGWSEVSSKAALHCNQMLSDITIVTRLHKKYPQNIRILQYEVFCNDPVEKTKQMSMFLNLNLTRGMLLYVKSVTLNKMIIDVCYWCTKVTNSKLVSYRWRFTINYSHVKEIDKNCVKLYKTVGFRAFTDKDSLKNISILSQVDTPLRFMSL